LLTGLIFFQCFWEACEARFPSCVFFNGFRIALARFPFFFFVRETGLSAPSRALLNYLFSLNSLSSLSLTNSVPFGAQGFQRSIETFFPVY
jgi:hypothetical protein